LTSTTITLAGMRFHVRVGILPHERELPQPLEVDLTVHRAAGATSVLDYRTLYALVESIVGAEPLDYLESVAESIVAGALRIEGVSAARVAVRKPHVALRGPLAYAEITVEGHNE
jgi:dihydroneopterin aldolase